jgi:hypothetical protein
MQDSASGLPRRPLPRRWVNKGKKKGPRLQHPDPCAANCPNLTVLLPRLLYCLRYPGHVVWGKHGMDLDSRVQSQE